MPTPIDCEALVREFMPELPEMLTPTDVEPIGNLANIFSALEEHFIRRLRDTGRRPTVLVVDRALAQRIRDAVEEFPGLLKPFSRTEHRRPASHGIFQGVEYLGTLGGANVYEYCGPSE